LDDINEHDTTISVENAHTVSALYSVLIQEEEALSKKMRLAKRISHNISNRGG